MTTQLNTWIVGASAAIAAAILMLTLAVAGQMDELRTLPAQSVQQTQVQGSVLSGTQAQAADQAAQSELRNTLLSAKAIQIDESSYASANSSASGLASSDPSLCYVGAVTASVASAAGCESGTGDASVSVFASSDSWAAARMSESGTCFWIADDSAGVRYGSGTPCTGTAAAEATAPSW